MSGATVARASTTVVPYVGMPYVDSPVALAGDSVISAVWRDDHSGHVGRIRIIRRTPDGVSTRIATLPAQPKASSAYTVMLRASQTTWAAGIRTVHIPSDSEEQQVGLSDMVVSGPVAGGAPRVLASCRTNGPDFAEDKVWVGVAGDDVAWSNAFCDDADGVRLASAGAPAQLVGGGRDVVLTPAHLGFFTFDDQRKIFQVEVLDRATGRATLVDADSASGFALGDGGLVAVTAKDDPACPGVDCAYSIMPVAPDGTIVRPGLAPVDNGGEPGSDPEPFVAGGGRVLAERRLGNGVMAVDLLTGARSYAGLLGLESFDTQPIAVDATRAVYAAQRCDGRPALFFEDTVVRAPSRLASAPCPVRVRSRTATLHLAKNTARVRFRCPRGCDATWLVVTNTDIGVVDFHAPAGAARTGRLELYRHVLKKLRGRRSIVVRLVDDGEDRPRARAQPPVRLTLRLRAT